jgi:hypothetical protein
MKKIILQFTFSFFLILCAYCAMAQSDTAAIAAADTTNFSVNKTGGWQLYNTFLTPFSTDSVQLEIIVSHDSSLPWQQDQYIGKIKSNVFIPSTTQTIAFNLLESNYVLTIDKEGRCYLRLVSGPAPYSTVAVIPVKGIYKK